MVIVVIIIVIVVIIIIIYLCECRLKSVNSCGAFLYGEVWW